MSFRSTALLMSAAVTLMAPSLALSLTDIPMENHYKVYKESVAEIPAIWPLTLRDQFGVVNIDIIQRTRFATPVSKDGSIVYDDKAHQSWFEVFPNEQPQREVTVTDQFGTFSWHLGNIAYLVAPAVKYPQPDDKPPVRNHYLCYEATVGPTVGRTVVLVDQFDNVQVVVLRGKLFCNPVEKTVDQTVYAIVDPAAHLACYLVENPTPYSQYVIVLDQFGGPEMHLVSNDCLCNPAIKGPVGTEQSTWAESRHCIDNARQTAATLPNGRRRIYSLSMSRA